MLFQATDFALLNSSDNRVCLVIFLVFLYVSNSTLTLKPLQIDCIHERCNICKIAYFDHMLLLTLNV